MATRGDIHFTPHYDTTYQHYHGYNERNLAAKASHWEREYQWHAPSAEAIRQRFIVRPGRDEAPRTRGADAQVAQVLQARGAAIGQGFDSSTRNSLRVTARHGESARPGDLPVPWPVPLAMSPTAQDSAHDAWARRTVPVERSSSSRMGGSSSAMMHPSKQLRGPPSLRAVERAHAQGDFNSRSAEGRYDSEYTSCFCDARQMAERMPTRANEQEFFRRSLDDFAATTERAATGSDLLPVVDEQGRVVAPAAAAARSQRFAASSSLGSPAAKVAPLVERVANERLSAASLSRMQRPLTRKEYPLLDDRFPAASRPSAVPYSFDLREHIEAMRPAPLFKDAREGRPVSELLQRPALPLGQAPSLFTMTDREIAAAMR